MILMTKDIGLVSLAVKLKSPTASFLQTVLLFLFNLFLPSLFVSQWYRPALSDSSDIESVWHSTFNIRVCINFATFANFESFLMLQKNCPISPWFPIVQACGKPLCQTENNWWWNSAGEELSKSIQINTGKLVLKFGKMPKYTFNAHWLAM